MSTVSWCMVITRALSFGNAGMIISSGKIKILKRSGKVRLFIATDQERHRAQYLMNEMGLE